MQQGTAQFISTGLGMSGLDGAQGFNMQQGTAQFIRTGPGMSGLDGAQGFHMQNFQYPINSTGQQQQPQPMDTGFFTQQAQPMNTTASSNICFARFKFSSE